MAQLQITIDDGPQPVQQALDPILAELANRHVRGAFFCIGQEVHADPAATRKIRDGGHVLGNHSWDHLEPPTANYSDTQVKDQFQRTHAEVLAATQVTMRHWRAPRLEQIQRLTALLTTGPSHLYDLSHCDSHADSKDSQGANDAPQMLQAIRGAIAANPNRTMFRLLFHVKATTAAALPAVLNGLTSDGHTLVDFAQTT
jgi:peptidoglycan/xylan/chitin deacetylase (PgdA/CDA1 family)